MILLRFDGDFAEEEVAVFSFIICQAGTASGEAIVGEGFELE